MAIRCLVIGFFLVATLAGATPLPPELSHLEGLRSDRSAFVDALRAFDKEQLGLARQEYEQAENERSEGHAEKAEELLKSASSRAQLVRKGYEIGLDYYPQDARLNNYYGEILYDVFGEEIRALNAWQRAVSLDDKLGEAHNNLGLHYFHIGRYELGLKHLDQAIKLDRQHPDFLFNLAQIYLIHWPEIKKIRGWNDRKIYREAMKLSERAAKLSPKDFSLQQDYAVNFFAAERFGQTANWRKAAQAWQAARPLAETREQTFYTWLNEARVWIRNGSDKQAIECLEKALELIPDSTVAQKLLGEAKERLGS